VRREREEERRCEAREEERVRRAQDLEERKRLDSFKPLSTTFFVDAETVSVSWGGPVNTIPNMLDPRTMSLEFFEAVAKSICRHPTEPLQPKVEYVNQPNVRQVWETDEGKTWRREIRSPELPDERSVLRVIPRAGPCSVRERSR